MIRRMRLCFLRKDPQRIIILFGFIGEKEEHGQTRFQSNMGNFNQNMVSIKPKQFQSNMISIEHGQFQSNMVSIKPKQFQSNMISIEHGQFQSKMISIKLKLFQSNMISIEHEQEYFCLETRSFSF
jgi:c-di-GMP-binding flagellar brake protein YcgR